MSNSNSNKIKFGIYGIALLMMGIIGISGALATIGANFPDVSELAIQNLIAIPCIVVIPVTVLVGKLMESISKKVIALVGAVLFLIGGVAPAFMSNFTLILVMRGIFGVGVGVAQVVSTALVAENFEGAEREKVQGNLQACQMLGCALLVFTAGALADVKYNLAYYVHFIAIITIVLVLLGVPNKKPVGAGVSGEQKPKTRMTKGAWTMAALTFALFIIGQTYSVQLSYLVVEKGIGSSTQAGLGIAFFAIGGFVMGLLFGKVSSKVKTYIIALGIAVMALGCFIVTFAGGMAACHTGSLLYGMGLSMALPGIFITTTTSVDPFSAGMAISIVTALQNLAQFCNPYLYSFIASALRTEKIVFTQLLLTSVLLAVLAVCMAVWGMKKKKEAADCSV
ncbi:MAG: MFS transporter [Clostridiales bacterium]|nr:MFS transporter [Clostridiales bacterium]